MSTISEKIQHAHEHIKGMLTDLNNEVCGEIKKVNEALKAPLFHLNDGHGIWERANPGDLQGMIDRIGKAKKEVQENMDNIKALTELAKMINRWALANLGMSPVILGEKTEQAQRLRNVAAEFESWHKCRQGFSSWSEELYRFMSEPA